MMAFAVTGCGGGRAAPPPPPVRLAVTAPADHAIIHADHVELRGTVRPANAAVTVLGRRAAVAAGAFRATVALEPGTNVVDVMATAGDARPAMTALRLRRQLTVRVPDVTGLPAPQARRRLEGLGLSVDEKEGLIDRLLPGDPLVCTTAPAAGSDVDPGTTIRVETSHAC